MTGFVVSATSVWLYSLMHPAAWFQPILAIPGAQVGAIMAHPKMARAALRKDAALLVYPGGAQDLFRPYNLRDRIHFAGHKGFIRLALLELATINCTTCLSRCSLDSNCFRRPLPAGEATA